MRKCEGLNENVQHTDTSWMANDITGKKIIYIYKT